MSLTIQSGMHPDAESLSAFAEQALIGAERDQILAHMASCSRCREVVFLAQRAMDAEQSISVSIAPVEEEKKSRGWFAGWRLAWVPAAALAGFVGFAVVQHMRYSVQDQQIARMEKKADSISGAIAGKAVNGPAMQQSPKRDESQGISANREGATPNKQENARVLDKKKAVAAKDLAMPTADAMGASAGNGGTVNGPFESRAKSSPIGGPMAQNQVQQQNYAQQNALVQAQSAAVDATSKKPHAPVVPSSLAAGAVSESVEVQPTFESAPAATRQMTTPAITEGSLEGRGQKNERPKSANVMLPSGHEALSVATAAQRSIAIDASGALFLSEDAGGHWQPVKTQWTGRAVLVRTPQIGADSAFLLKQQAQTFELVCDNLRIWVSADGKTWTEKNLPAKSSEP